MTAKCLYADSLTRTVPLLCFLLFLVSCKHVSDSPPKGFHAEVMLKTTPVKKQTQDGLAWLYAMFATIETNRLMRGDSVNLSTDYVIRYYLFDLSVETFRTKDEERLSLTGTGPMAIKLLRDKGTVIDASYYRDEPVNYSVVVNKIMRLIRLAWDRQWTEETFCRQLNALLDRETGTPPAATYLFGAQYSPREFAHSVCGQDEYTVFTSTGDEPLHRLIRLPFRNNKTGCRGWNIEKDSLVSRIRNSLNGGHAVMWEGEDHGNDALCLIGMGQGMDGKTYFVGKGSLKNGSGNAGLVYLSAEYLRGHTAVAVIRDSD